jgi:hypothetical protein
MNRALLFDLATARFIAWREDALVLGPPGTGKSHLAQAIGRAAIHQGYRVTYREAHSLLEEIAEAAVDGTRKTLLTDLATVPLLIIDDLGMRKLPHTAAEDFLELIMRRYERASTLLTSNRPVDDWGKLLGDTAAVTALLDRLLHHAHVLKCGPKSWRTNSGCSWRRRAVSRWRLHARSAYPRPGQRHRDSCRQTEPRHRPAQSPAHPCWAPTEEIMNRLDAAIDSLLEASVHLQWCLEPVGADRDDVRPIAADELRHGHVIRARRCGDQDNTPGRFSRLSSFFVCW